MMRGGPETAQGGSPWPTGPQAQLLLAAIGPDPGVEHAFRAWGAMIDIDDHMDGGSFRLLPQVFDRLRGLDLDHPLMGRLKGLYRRAWYETNQLFADMAPVIGALEAAGVRTMLLKGAPLALSYYRTPAARPMFDVDFAVRQEQYDQAVEVLLGLGWTVGATLKPHELPYSHAVDLKNAAGREADIHRHILREAPSEVADDWFWRTARPLDFCGVATLQPSPTAMLLNIITHGLRSNLEPPIRWIADATMVISTAGDEVDWDELVRFAVRQKLCHRLHMGLEHLATVYAAPIPAGVLAALKRPGVSLIERIENVVYLSRAETRYRPFLFPLVDYWRHLRNERPVPFARGFVRYVQDQWNLRHPAQIPVALAGPVTRRVKRMWARA